MEKEKRNQHYYVVRENALTQTLRHVVEVNNLLSSREVSSISEAIRKVGISRSSYYKYKDKIFPFDEKARGKTLTLVITLSDEPGMLSKVLHCIAEGEGNILTIHQSIPINSKATLTISIRMAPGEGDAEAMVSEIEQMRGVDEVKLLGSE
ncbi:MAG: ACT domain-containing protein [Blautia sp.]|nr:ACT domain-containing protein [Blautia sp.]